MKKIYLLLIIAASIASCHTTQKRTPLTAENIVAKMQIKYPNYTVAELTNGKILYTQHCGTCHDLKDPTALNEAAWKKIVPPMCKKVNEENANTLNATDEEIILKYVISMHTVAH